MKTTKQERIRRMAVGFINIFEVDKKKHMPEIMEAIEKENIYKENEKLSTEERTLIGDIVERYS